MNVAPAATFEATFESGTAGLVGTVAVGIYDNGGGVTEALSTAGIIETPAGSGVYAAARTAPATAGQYTLVWSRDGSTDPDQVSIEDLVVTAAPEAVVGTPPVLGGEWITAEDVAAACDALEATDPAVYDNAAAEASQILYILSGRLYPGLVGPVTVRPCEPRGCLPYDPCGCCHLSRVKLAGHVREVTAVKIDGEVVSPSGYRVDRHRWLVRLADADGRPQRWPGCQRLDLADTEDKTFSVAYTYGQDPPLAGQQAAIELACQLAAFGVLGECGLPANTVRVTRQGVTIDLENTRGEWWAALPLVAGFLATYNPSGLRRRSALWSPDVTPYAQRVG